MGLADPAGQFFVTSRHRISHSARDQPNAARVLQSGRDALHDLGATNLDGRIRQPEGEAFVIGAGDQGLEIAPRVRPPSGAGRIDSAAVEDDVEGAPSIGGGRLVIAACGGSAESRTIARTDVG